MPNIYQYFLLYYLNYLLTLLLSVVMKCPPFYSRLLIHLKKTKQNIINQVSKPPKIVYVESNLAIKIHRGAVKLNEHFKTSCSPSSLFLSNYMCKWGKRSCSCSLLSSDTASQNSPYS